MDRNTEILTAIAAFAREHYPESKFVVMHLSEGSTPDKYKSAIATNLSKEGLLYALGCAIEDIENDNTRVGATFKDH